MIATTEIPTPVLVLIGLAIIYAIRYYLCKGELVYVKTPMNEQILKRTPILKECRFLPTFYLHHPLLQSHVSDQFLNPDWNLRFNCTYEEVQLNGGGHTLLATPHHPNPEIKVKHPKVLMVIFPGLTGSSDSSYIIALCNLLMQNGYRCIVYHARWNSPQIVLPKAGHMNILDDCKQTFEYLSKKEKDVKFFGIGFSYGANLLTNYLGSYPKNNPFMAGVSIANPFNFILAEAKIRNGIADRVISNLLKKMIKKSQDNLAKTVRFKLNFDELYSLTNTRQFDVLYTVNTHGYESPDDYYWDISSCRRFNKIEVPFLMMQAHDDIMIHERAYIKENIVTNPNVILMMTPYGGHQGWVEGVFKVRRWYMKPLIEYVNAVVELNNK